MKRKMRKVLSLVLALSMVLSLAVMPASALTNSDQVEKAGSAKYYNLTGGTTTSGADDHFVTVKKTAKATGTENLFDITLDVTTKSKTDYYDLVKDSAVVLTIDFSNTMTQNNIGSKTRLAVALEKAQDFVKSYGEAGQKAGAKRYVAVVAFSSPAQTYINWIDVSNATNRSDVLSKIGSMSSNSFWKKYGAGGTAYRGGATNMEGGLQLTYDLLTNSVPSGAAKLPDGIAKKYAILLSDGSPTMHIDKDGNSKDVKGDYYYYCNCNGSSSCLSRDDGTGSNVNGADYKRAQTVAANIQALSNTEVYAIAVAASAWLDSETFGGSTAATWLANEIASSTSKMKRADDAAGVASAFTSINTAIKTETIPETTSVNAISVSDPLPSNIELVSGPSVTTGSTSVDSDDDITWTLNATSKGTYTMTYRVRLMTEKSGFNANTDYPTNGTTTLKYKAMMNGSNTGSNKTANFDVPAVEGYKGSYTFTKTDPNGNPVAGAVFTLSHKSNCSCGGGTAWSAEATSASDGKVSFSGIPSGHTFTLTEKSAPTGYNKNTASATVTVAYGVASASGSLFAKSGIVHNNPIQEYKDFTVKKVWTNGNVGASEVVVEIVRNEDSKVVATLTLNAANNWQDTAEDIPTINTANFSTYTFSVREKTGSGYTLASNTGFNSSNVATITNTRTTGNITLQKNWVNTPDKFKTEVTVRLLQNGNTYGDYTLNSSNSWKKTVSNVPTYDTSGQAYTYTVVELQGSTTKGNGATIKLGNENFTVSISGTTVTNTFDMPKTSLSGTKTWKAGAMGIDDLSATVTLYADGVSTGKTANVTGTNTSYSFTNLDKYDADGDVIKYTVKETAICDAPAGADWNTNYSGNNITNTLTGTVDIAGEKIWDDPNDSERPASITVELYRNEALFDTYEIAANAELDGEGNPTGEYSWADVDLSFAFEGLAKYDAAGNLYRYTVKEAGESQGKLDCGEITYDVTYDGNDIINTLNGGEKTVSVQKIWIDAESEHDELTFAIYRADTDEQVDTIVLDGTVDETETAAWYASKNFVKYEDGEEINYYVRELDVDGSAIENNGRYSDDYTVTFENEGNSWIFRNKIDQEYVEISFRKIWAGQADAVKPGAVFTLWKNNRATNMSVTWDESETEIWDELGSEGFYTFSDLEKYSFNGDTCTVNTYLVKEDLSGTKELLARYGHDGTSATVFGEADEEGVFTFTNTFRNDTVTVSGRKYWFGMGYSKQVDVGVYAAGTLVSQTVTEGENFEYSFTGLTKYNNDGTVIEYYVRELQDNGDGTYTMVLPGNHYTSAGNEYVVRYNGYDIYNTLKQEKVDVPFTKVWRGPVGSAVTIELYRDDPADDAEAAKIDEVTLTAEDANAEDEKVWTGKFENLDVYNAARTARFVYTIKEAGTVTEEGSDVTVLPLDNRTYVAEMLNEYTVRNTVVDPGNGTFTVNKVWVGDGYTAENGEEVTVQLLIDGKPYGESVKLNVENEWTHTFENLPLYDCWGEDESLWTYESVTYSVVELDQYGRYITEANGSTISLNEGSERYHVSYDGGTVTNTFADRDSYFYRVYRHYNYSNYGDVQTFSDHDADWTESYKGEEISIDAKQWVDCATDDLSVTYKFVSENTTVKQGSFSGYPFDLEDGVVSYVEEKYVDGENRYEIHLYYQFTRTRPNNPPSDGPKDYTVVKVWNDNNDEAGLRPDSITVELTEDGIGTGKVVTLSEDNNWTHTWKDLSSESDWSVDELDVPEGYTSSVRASGTKITVTNTLTTEDIPEEDPPQGGTPGDPLIEIPDEEPPLADVPKTGDPILLWLAAAAASGAGFFGLVGKKKEEDFED